MSPDHDQVQRIARLMPLTEVLARVDALVGPVAARETAIAGAIGRVLADDVMVAARPSAPLALIDGWAVAAEATTDASSYAPAPLSAALRIGTGEPLPAATDAVAPFDAVTIVSGRVTIDAPVGAGEGTLPAGGDVDGRGALLHAGRRLTPLQAAVLAATGTHAAVRIRAPRVRLVAVRPGDDPIVRAACEWIAGAIAAAGGEARMSERTGIDVLVTALADDATDAVVAIGGTGSGPHDAGVLTLARHGRLEMHGLALAPGETAAFGMAERRPVLLLPGRVDAAVAVWLVIGRRVMARLTGAGEDEAQVRATLTRKIASRLGLAEWVPVRLQGNVAEPIASGYVPLSALAQSDGWLLVPADSEGYPAGTEVVIRAWP
jgi:molybdopterin molybdotransferase